MWEEAAKTYFLGVEVYAFGLYAALGASVGMIVLALLLRKEKWKKGTAALTGCCVVGLGFVISRLFFGLMDAVLARPFPLWAMAMVTGGGYSMMGALLGACMGAILSARLTGQSAPRLLDLLAPCLMLFVASERLGEGYIDGFGASRTLIGHLFPGTFLAVEGVHESYLATYKLESAAALILAVVLMRDLRGKRRAGDTFLLFFLLFGASQTILESLRYDQHMRLSFVGLQHVMSILVLGAGVIVLAIRRWKERRGLALAAVLSVFLAAGIGVALEFAIDRTQMNRYLIYLMYVIVMGAPAYLGIRLRKEERHGKA